MDIEALRRDTPGVAHRVHLNQSPEHTQLDTEDRGVHPLVRLSPHYYNTEAELGRAVAAIAALLR